MDRDMGRDMGRAIDAPTRAAGSSSTRPPGLGMSAPGEDQVQQFSC